MSQPAVSVLVTTFRHARYVEECLDSLAAQTCRDFETIITDDASGDETADIIEQWLTRTGFPAYFIRNPVNRGICANRNTALALARGRFVASLSGDDAYHPERMERQLSVFAAEPDETAFVYSDATIVDAESRPLCPSFLEHALGAEAAPEGNVFRKLLLGANFLPPPAVMIRRAALDAVGHYDESLFFEDLYMWLKLSHRFRIHYVPGCLARYRMLPDSMCRAPAMQSAMAESTFRVLSAWTGKCGDADVELREHLWSLALERLYAGDDIAARRMMSVLAAGRGKWRRQAAARLTSVPGGCALVRGLGRTYGGMRGMAAGARPR